MWELLPSQEIQTTPTTPTNQHQNAFKQNKCKKKELLLKKINFVHWKSIHYIYITKKLFFTLLTFTLTKSDLDLIIFVTLVKAMLTVFTKTRSN